MSAGERERFSPLIALGLVLVWTRTRGPLNVLQLVFGLTYTNLSVYLRFGICLFVETFRHDPLASVRIPSAETIETFQDAFAVRHPLLNDCWATMDGLKLYCSRVVMLKYKNGIVMGGRTTTMSHPYFVFAPMGRYQLRFSTSLDLYTTVRLQSSETYTTG